MSFRSKNFESYLLPTLSVSGAAEAIEFYKQAFGAKELMRVSDEEGKIVAEIAIENIHFIVADESPEHGNVAANKLSTVSVRLGLMVADPDAVAKAAVSAGAETVYPVADQSYGYRLGHFIDPFGHHWEIGKPITSSPDS